MKNFLTFVVFVGVVLLVCFSLPAVPGRLVQVRKSAAEEVGVFFRETFPEKNKGYYMPPNLLPMPTGELMSVSAPELVAKSR